MKTSRLCLTCGTQYPPATDPPAHCPICEDERQYLPPGGQKWTTLEQLRKGHRNSFLKKEALLYGIGTVPDFAIAQRALLIQTPKGNLLWDCISLLDQATIDFVRGLGGLSAIAISHPHYYSSMVEWSQAFGGIPIYLHAADRSHVMRPDPAIHFWEGETLDILEDISLIRCGGHFAGGTVLHWKAGADGKGALLTGDIIQIIPDRNYVSFMYSYPNLIPLPASAVQRIAAAVAPFAFDRMYGAWWGRVIPTNAKAVVQRSAERYVKMLEGKYGEWE
jgi:hypothetical protein